MAVAGTLKYDTKLDTKDYQKGLEQISASTIAKGTLMADAFKLVANKLIDVVKGGITYNATIEQLSTSFEVMTGSADEATKLVERLKKAGAETPYELTGLAETTQLLMQYGLDAEEAYNSTMQLGDISQGSAEKMQRIGMAYGQMSSAGKVHLQDIKQMIEAGFNPLNEISETTGESMTSLYDRISKGTISVDEITASMQRSSEEGGKYYQSMEKQSQTLNGQLSTLQDNWNELTGTLAKGVTDVLTNSVLPALNSLISGTGDYNDALVLVGIAIGTVTALIIAYNIQQALATAGLTLWQAVAGVATAITTGLGTAFAFLTSPIGLVILAIGAVIAIGYLLIKHWGEVKQFAINIFSGIANFFGGIANKIGGFFSGMFDVGRNIVTGIWNGIVNAKDWLMNKVKSFATGIINGIKSTLGIHSPSTKARDLIGKQLPAGIAIGVEANTDSALKSIDNMNDEIMDRMRQAVNIETAKSSFSGTSGSVSQILTANGTTTVNLNNETYLDGEKVYENQKTVTAKKNLQYQFA